MRKIPVWVKFYSIPTEYWTLTGLSYITSAVGKPLYMDKLTKEGSRATFSRICVEVDASEPLLDAFDLIMEGDSEEDSEKIEIKVVYQWKPV